MGSPAVSAPLAKLVALALCIPGHTRVLWLTCFTRGKRRMQRITRQSLARSKSTDQARPVTILSEPCRRQKIKRPSVRYHAQLEQSRAQKELWSCSSNAEMSAEMRSNLPVVFLLMCVPDIHHRILSGALNRMFHCSRRIERLAKGITGSRASGSV